MTLIRSLRTGASRIKGSYFELELNEGESVMRDIILLLDRFGDHALLLGRVGENRATRVLIDIKSILSQYPDAIASITVKPLGRAEYPAAVKQEGGILTWEITDADIGDKAGSGQAQITIQDADGTVIKTAIACTRVGESLGNATAPAPDPVKTWIDKATGTLAEVERSGAAAQTIADEVKRKLDAGELKGEPGRDGADGKPGKDGAAGATGATPQIKAEAVTGEPGTQVSVTQSGTPENPTLSFKIPRGEPGRDGAKGEPGDPGKDAPQEAVLYTAQTLDDAQKAQARENIGAADEARQNILVGSEMGNPIAIDDAFAAPLRSLTVYGKSTQDGTPTPDAPVPIVSAGDGGNVTVKVTGANMLEGTKPGVKSTANGITYTTYENGVLITGTATNTVTITLHEDLISRLTRGIYYLTAKGLSPSVMLNFYFVGKFSSDMQNQKVMLTRDVEYSLRLQISKGATLNTNVQVSLTKDKSTAYSPYREQLLTLPTPNGLPGIPVTSGGNYTDENGQQWVCDEVDLERGVRVQRVDKAAFDSTKTLAEQNAILATPIETPLTPDEITAYKALTTYAHDTVVQASDGAGLKLGYQRDVSIVIKNLEDAIASMTAT